MRSRHTHAPNDNGHGQGKTDADLAHAQIRVLAASWFPGLAADVLEHVIETAWADTCAKRADAPTTETLVSAGAAAVRRVGLQALRGEPIGPNPAQPAAAPTVGRPAAPSPPPMPPMPDVRRPAAPSPPPMPPPVPMPNVLRPAPSSSQPATQPPIVAHRHVPGPPPAASPRDAALAPATAAAAGAAVVEHETAVYVPDGFVDPPVREAAAHAKPPNREPRTRRGEPARSRRTAVVVAILGCLLVVAVLLTLVISSDRSPSSPGRIGDETVTAREALARVELATFASLSDRIAATEHRRLAAERRVEARRLRAARRRATAARRAARRARARRAAARRGALAAPIRPRHVAPPPRFVPAPPPPPPVRHVCDPQDEFCY